MSASLSNELRQTLLDLLRKFKDVFAWTYVEMPGLDLQLVTHKLNMKEGTKTIKQSLRNPWPELAVQIKQKPEAFGC